MPNQGNKSNGKSGIVQPKKNTTMPSTEKQRSDNATKNSKGGKGQKGDTDSSADKGSKKASGGSGNG